MIYILFLISLVSSSKILKEDVKVYFENVKQEKYFDDENNVSFNPSGKQAKNFFDVIKWRLTTSAKEWPSYVENKFEFSYQNIDIDSILNVTYVNHSTFLLQFNNLNILTDPVFSERVSPVSFAGPKRVRESGIKINDLKKVDIVIISHNHYDHLDIESLKEINSQYKPLFLIPFGDAELFKDNDIFNFIELKWWQTVEISPKIKITYTPSQHFSNRGLFDKNESLWGSFIINYNNSQVYFAGDTGYSTHFKDISNHFKNITLSFLPIGAYSPRWFMKNIHTDPLDAVKAHIDLNSIKSIGMHYGTFQLTDEGINDPIIDLHKALKKFNISKKDFLTLEIGKTYTFNLYKYENSN